MTKAIILCAGEGTRLLPITKNLPKPMILIGKYPLLEYNILLCKKYGIEEIFINTSHFPEKIKEYFGNGSKWGVKITYSFEKTLLGTAGALINFKDSLDEDFFVIYGDNLTNLNLRDMLEYHKKNNSLATLFIYQDIITDKESTCGAVVVDDNKNVEKIIEHPTKKEAIELEQIPESKKYINAGIYVLNPQILNYITQTPIDFPKNIFPKAIKSGEKISGFTSDCFFRELGSRERYELTQKEISENRLDLGLSPSKNKALFLDRDGTINKMIKKYSNFYGKVMDDTPFKLEELKFNDGVKELLESAREKGYIPIIVTNQSSIAKGDCSIEDYEKITKEICATLKIERTNIFECFHRQPFTEECSCRKPKPGLFFMAEEAQNIDLKNSIMVGDASTDILAAKNARIEKTFYLRRKKSEDQIGNHEDEISMKEKNITPTNICDSLLEIIKYL